MGKGPVEVFNIYVDCLHDNALEVMRRRVAEGGRDRKMVWLGDFNRHHPLWEAPRNAHMFTRANMSSAERLIDLMREAGMEMVLPAGLPTLENSAGNTTRPDNVFASTVLEGDFVRCKPCMEMRPSKADHFTILIELELDVRRVEREEKRLNYRKENWEEYRKKVERRLRDWKKEGPARIEDA